MMDPTGNIGANHLPWLSNFWQTQMHLIEQGEIDFKSFNLPLARIKKVMKTDDEVKNMMISAEAPVVFAKACEIFILELTLRAWMHTDECKRRTLQRNDVAVAISRSDVFDFLIDIVPRDETKSKKADYTGALIGDGTGYGFYGGMGLQYAQMPQSVDQQAMYQAQYMPQGNEQAYNDETA